MQRYASCRCAAAVLLANLVQTNAAARAMLRGSPEFGVLHAALTAAASADYARSHDGTGRRLEATHPGIELCTAEGSSDAEDAQGRSWSTLVAALRSFEEPVDPLAEAEAWARRVAAADAAAAALLAEEEAEAAPKGAAAAAAAAAAAPGKKKKAGSSARRRAKAAAASSVANADAGAALAGLELNDDISAAPAHEDDPLCVVCLDAPRDTALACCGTAHQPLLCAHCAALLARASGGPVCPWRCTQQP